LKDHSHIALKWGQARGILITEEKIPAGWRVQTRYNIQESRFSGTRRSENNYKLARLDLDIDALKSPC
jgi:hypothetical protein